MAGPQIRRVRAVWQSGQGGPYITNFYFEWKAGNAQAVGDLVNTFLTGIKSLYTPSVIPTVQSDQAIINTATGDIENMETTTGYSGIVGTATGEPLPWQTQGLLRLRTDAFNEGRRLLGRLYIPGPTEGNSTGWPSGTYLSALESAANTLRTGSATPGSWAVYSRRYSSWANISGLTAWNQWASQRRRRD